MTWTRRSRFAPCPTGRGIGTWRAPEVLHGNLGDLPAGNRRQKSEGAVVAWRRVTAAERRVPALRAPQTGRRVPIRLATARTRI